MQTKMMTVTEMGEAGKGLAILARLSEIDHDGDTYAKGAFNWKGDQWSPLIHHHDRYQMPFGKARVYEEGDIAFAELHLNLETQAGKDWHAALMFDLSTGKAVQEYSYGFDVVDADFQVRGENRVRILKQVDVHEVSTVIRGAGRGTGTVSMKGLKAALKQGDFGELTGALGMMAETLRGDPDLLSATGRKQLEAIHADLGKALLSPSASLFEALLSPTASLFEALEVKAQTDLSRALNARIDQQADDDEERSAIIDRMASAAGIDRGTVLQILRGDIATPPEERIRGFARVLDIPVARLEALVDRGDEGDGKAAFANEVAKHLTRAARLKLGRR